MHGKALIMLDGAAAIALIETVSKNQALDMIADIARGELGETATDVAVLEWIEARIAPVLAARYDRPTRVLARYQRSLVTSARFLAQLADQDRINGG